MSHIALHPAYIARPSWLSAVRDWLRQARVAVNLPHQNVEDLSDRQLRDIGAARKDIAKAMDRELAGSGCWISVGSSQGGRGVGE